MNEFPLPVYEVMLAAQIVVAAEREAKVRWLNDSGDIISGTLRHLHAKSDDDLRTARVRVTLDNGLEFFTTVLELAEKNAFHVED